MGAHFIGGSAFKGNYTFLVYKRKVGAVLQEKAKDVQYETLNNNEGSYRLEENNTSNTTFAPGDKVVYIGSQKEYAATITEKLNDRVYKVMIDDEHVIKKIDA